VIGTAARRLWLVAAAAGTVWPAASALAQTTGGGLPPRHEVVASVVGIGRVPLGATAADLTRPGGGSLPVFRAETRAAAGTGVEALVGLRVTEGFAVEVAGSWQRTEFQAEVSGDLEGAAPVVLTGPFTRLAINGSAVWTWRRRSRLPVFLRGGAGWMEELADGATASAIGTLGNVGAGVKYWWNDSPGRRVRVGLRAEARALIRVRGLTFGARTVSLAPAASAGFVIGF
jgi:hypothetical protein